MDQFIDRTFARVKTFFEDEIVAHVSMAHPTSNGLMNACEEAIKNEKIDSIKSLLNEHNGTHNLSFHIYDDEEKIIVEMDSEKQKINITPKLLSDLEVKNIFYKLN